MVCKIGITIDEWLFKEIENRRGEKNRSEYISEQIARGLGYVDTSDEGSDEE